MQQLSIEIFGAFRDFRNDNLLFFDYADGMTVQDLKNLLKAEFQGQEPFVSLLSKSRIASETQILGDHDSLTGAGGYALLPPVNGG